MNRPMNKIGFAISGEGEMRTPREFDHDYRMDEMAYRKGGERMTGYGAASGQCFMVGANFLLRGKN